MKFETDGFEMTVERTEEGGLTVALVERVRGGCEMEVELTPLGAYRLEQWLIDSDPKANP